MTPGARIVTYLTDILVPHSADLLDISGGLGHVLERVAGEHDLILDVGRGLDADTGQHGDATNDLLAQEVAILLLAARSEVIARAST